MFNKRRMRLYVDYIDIVQENDFSYYKLYTV